MPNSNKEKITIKENDVSKVETFILNDRVIFEIENNSKVKSIFNDRKSSFHLTKKEALILAEYINENLK